MADNSISIPHGSPTRRELLKRGAAGGVLIWSAPAILSLPAGGARAQATPQPGQCPGTAKDFQVDFTGPVTGQVGPTRQFPQSPGCLANLAATFPGATDPFATATEGCAGATGTPPNCCTFAQIAGANADLTDINAAFDVQFSATVLRADACCTPTGRTLDSTIAMTSLTIGGTNVPVDADPAPNTTIPVPGLGNIILNEQVGGTVRAVHIVLADPILGQGVDIVIAEASVTCP